MRSVTLCHTHTHTHTEPEPRLFIILIWFSHFQTIMIRWRRHLWGGDPSEAHWALIHVDAHLILITKMQFPASQRRLMDARPCRCSSSAARRHQQDGWMALTQAPLIHSLVCLTDVFMTRVSATQQNATNSRHKEKPPVDYSMVLVWCANGSRRSNVSRNVVEFISRFLVFSAKNYI